MRRIGNCICGAVVLAALSLLPAGVRAQQGEAAVDDLIKYEYGQDRAAFNLIEEQIRKADGKGREAIEATLLQVLGSRKATVAAKQTAALLMPRVGSCRSALPLAQLVPDREITHAALAALQVLPCPEVPRLIRDRLTALKGEERREAVNTLGHLRDRTSLPFLAALVKDQDPGIVESAIAAIGRIGGDEAARALKSLSVPERFQPTWADAYLMTADSLLAANNKAAAAQIYRDLSATTQPAVVQAAALGGLVRAEGKGATAALVAAIQSDSPVLRNAGARFVNQLTGPDVTSALVGAIPQAKPVSQLLLVSSLELRGDKSALAALTQLLVPGTDQAVRLAAIRALGTLGDQGTVDPLFKSIKAEQEESRSASESLRLLRGSGVDEAIAGYLKNNDPQLRAAAIRVLALRKYKPALGDAMAGTQDSDPAVRLESWRALNDLAGPDQLHELIQLMFKANNPREQSAAEQAVQTAAQRNPDPAQKIDPLLAAMAGKPAEARNQLLRVMARLGGPKAMDTVRAGLKDNDPEVRDNAVRLLAEWGDQSTLPDLLNLARSSDRELYSVLGLRGYVRLVMAQSGVPEQDRLSKLREVSATAKEPEARKLLLGAFGGVADPGALREIEPFLKDSQVSNEAEAAYARVAMSIRRNNKAEAIAALKRVVAEGRDQRTKEQAKEALATLEQ